MSHVAVCVTTYQRPRGLARLLRSLNALVFSGERPDVTVIVVDNDQAETARETVEQCPRSSDMEVRYVVEPRRGIPFGRNRALASLPQETDFVAFVDDDEAVAPDWLARLLDAQQRYGADVVAGPVIAVFEPDAPRWAIRGRFFQRPRHASGTRLQVAFTCNVLVRAEIIRQMEHHFDERFRLNGADDSHFFRRLARSGRKLVWADDACVREWIPNSRVTAPWLMQRAFRTGNGMAMITTDLSESAWRHVVVVSKSLVWMVIGIVAMPISAVLGKHRLVRAAQYTSYGLGLLLGVFGVQFQEYRRVHGC